ncbi:alpha/beta hydrolase [Streptomyces sp. MST-110588]|uniref:alpha/beta fold hydrolase n=1 Tax=Streptomyces sp. MST-110588 TaxID=2833628 RepID=UPI001F5E0F2B|nr:alpha/beta hydrolase [Streptomyces sp. MST-110588]UNO43167.1 alpha/beta hydrolase [Streptomyces sp. MST-110588]
MNREPSRPIQPIHVTVWDESTPGAPRAVLVHGTMTWGTECFAAQRPLADQFRLEVADRRGFGDSPDTERGDYAVDAQDVVELLGNGAHLVGHSYGGVVALLAAADRPRAVHSLTLIEPSALRVAAGNPVVAAALDRLRAAAGNGPAARTDPEEYLRASAEPFGLPVPEPTPRVLRAVRSAMAERPSWDAEVPLGPIASAEWPKVVVNGTWERAHPAYREFVGEALAACGETVAELIGARHVRVEGAGHLPHQERPDVVNDVLRRLWQN